MKCIYAVCPAAVAADLYLLLIRSKFIGVMSIHLFIYYWKRNAERTGRQNNNNKKRLTN